MPLFTLTDGNDTFPVLQDTAGNDTVHGLNGNDVIDGGPGNDVVFGGDGDDRLMLATRSGLFDDDRLYGGDGNDRMVLQSRPTGDVTGSEGLVLDGGAGKDAIFISAYGASDISLATITGIERLESEQAVTLTTAQALGFVRIELLAGATLTLADGGAFIPTGAFVVSHVIATAPLGQLIDLSRVTQESPEFEFSTITGTIGNDTIVAADGTDGIYGGKGHDILTAARADDTQVFGEAGNDTLTGRRSGDFLFGGAGDDGLAGRDGDDTLIADRGNDALRGGGGLDRLYGEGDNDLLRGGRNNDWLDGGSGQDTLKGGAGADRFIFSDAPTSSAAATGIDRIRDFQVGTSTPVSFVDRVDLSQIDAIPADRPNNAFTFIGTADFTAAGQVRVLQDGADTLVKLNTDNDLKSEFTIRLNNVDASAIDAADFVL